MTEAVTACDPVLEGEPNCERVDDRLADDVADMLPVDNCVGVGEVDNVTVELRD